MMQAMVCIDASLSPELKVEVDREVGIDVLKTPFQAMARLLTTRAAGARTKAIKRDKPQKNKPEELDRRIVAVAEKNLDDTEKAFARRLAFGIDWDKVRVAEKNRWG